MDIVERLRPHGLMGQSAETRLRQEAADEIERLREEKEELRKEKNGNLEVISWFIKYCHANGLKPDIVDLLEASLQQKDTE